MSVAAVIVLVAVLLLFVRRRDTVSIADAVDEHMAWKHNNSEAPPRMP